jgi:hypothetical protein
MGDIPEIVHEGLEGNSDSGRVTTKLGLRVGKDVRLDRERVENAA